MDILGAIVGWFAALFADLFELLTDVFLWILEQVLTLVKTAIENIPGLDGLAELIVSSWNLVPSEVRDLAFRLGAAEVTAIIVAALIVRLLLQLIPFVRLGS